jgi:alkylation response protein AidB-like acyl-CoA dehydrogenase
MSEQSQPQLFDLTLSDEQALMRETVRRFAANEMRANSRKADEAAAAPPDFYAKSAELGFNMVPIAEELGGIGAPRSPVSNMLIAEDLAYGDMSLAIGALSALSFINTVIDAGTPEQQKRLLPPFTLEGFRAATVAFMEPGLRFDPLKLRAKARKDGAGYVLSGEKTMVPLGASAEAMLVIADEEGVGAGAFVIEKGQAGVSCARESFMGLRPLELCKVELDGVKVAASDRLGTADKPFNLRRFVDLSRIGIGALALGAGQAVLDYVKQYCNDRIAFGEPITNRQAVAFMIADIAIELDGMRLLVYRAAARAERGLDFHREAYLAAVQCAEKGMKIGTDGVQLLGGHGFIREHMVELWYRNLRALGILEGYVTV